MELPDGAFVRFQSLVQETYLHADEDGVGVPQRPLGASLGVATRVNRVLRDDVAIGLMHGAAAAKPPTGDAVAMELFPDRAFVRLRRLVAEDVPLRPLRDSLNIARCVDRLLGNEVPFLLLDANEDGHQFVCAAAAAARPPISAEAAMELFPDGAFVRLRRLAQGTLLHADEDGVGVPLRPLCASPNVTLRVHRVIFVFIDGAAYGRYLHANEDGMGAAMIMHLVVEAIPLIPRPPIISLAVPTHVLPGGFGGLFVEKLFERLSVSPPRDSPVQLLGTPGGDDKTDSNGRWLPLFAAPLFVLAKRRPPRGGFKSTIDRVLSEMGFTPRKSSFSTCWSGFFAFTVVSQGCTEVRLRYKEALDLHNQCAELAAEKFRSVNKTEVLKGLGKSFPSHFHDEFLFCGTHEQLDSRGV